MRLNINKCIMIALAVSFIIFCLQIPAEMIGKDISPKDVMCGNVYLTSQAEKNPISITNLSMSSKIFLEIRKTLIRKFDLKGIIIIYSMIAQITAALVTILAGRFFYRKTKKFVKILYRIITYLHYRDGEKSASYCFTHIYTA